MLEVSFALTMLNSSGWTLVKVEAETGAPYVHGTTLRRWCRLVALGENKMGFLCVFRGDAAGAGADEFVGVCQEVTQDTSPDDLRRLGGATTSWDHSRCFE